MIEVIRRKVLQFLSRLAPLGLAAVVVPLPGGNVAPSGRTVPFKEAHLVIEYNATGQDIGIQFSLDGEGWKTINILDPGNNRIFSSDSEGILVEQGGATELAVESVEPSLDDLSMHDFFHRFPEGRYRFNGRSDDGKRFGRSAELSHTLPAAPDVTAPDASDDCDLNLFTGGMISWQPVVTDIHGNALDVESYEVIIESADEGEAAGEGDTLDVRVGGSVNQLTIPGEFLDADEDYPFEVIAIAENGNKTITEGCFHTLP